MATPAPFIRAARAPRRRRSPLSKPRLARGGLPHNCPGCSSRPLTGRKSAARTVGQKMRAAILTGVDGPQHYCERVARGILMVSWRGDAARSCSAIGMDDGPGWRDPARFHRTIAGREDQRGSNMFSQAGRETADGDSPAPFSESIYSLESRLADLSDRTVERVDPVTGRRSRAAAGRTPGRIAARWIDLIDLRGCSVDPDESPMLRALAGDLVDSAARRGREDVLLAGRSRFFRSPRRGWRAQEAQYSTSTRPGRQGRDQLDQDTVATLGVDECERGLRRPFEQSCR